MRFKDLLHETLSALSANKGRTFLTILGIVIGISAVIAMTSLIGGIKQSLVSELGLEQSRMISIGMYMDGREMTYDDLMAIQENVEGYEFVTGVQFATQTVSTQKKSFESSIVGAEPGLFKSMSMKASEGRLLSDAELASEAEYVVLDTTAKRELFGADGSCVGETVRIAGIDFTVAGVVEGTSALTMGGTVYMPFNTCAVRVTGSNEISQITAFAAEGVDIDDLSKRTEQYLRSVYKIDDETGYLYVQSMKAIQDELDTMMMSFQMLMTAVASISLLVGGIGIMNMMLTNVTERIREIGLRKALGARNRDITRQFLLEAIAACLVGGVIGFALGLLAAWGLGALASVAGGSLGLEGMSITPAVSMETVIMAVSICVIIGIIFGIGPARRAAKLDPVESLRYQ